MSTTNAIKYLFTLPLMFQVILLDSPSKAGTRLVIPCLATPLGGLTAGIVMSRWGKLAWIVRAGAALMLIGNTLVMLLRFNDSEWKYLAFVIPANLGQGMVYPGILFTFLAAFDHSGKLYSWFQQEFRFYFPNPEPRRSVDLLLTSLQITPSPLQLSTSSAPSEPCGGLRSPQPSYRTH
jgi:hypothetical protein